jgi:type III secretory pathway component EscU
VKFYRKTEIAIENINCRGTGVWRKILGGLKVKINIFSGNKNIFSFKSNENIDPKTNFEVHILKNILLFSICLKNNESKIYIYIWLGQKHATFFYGDEKLNSGSFLSVCFSQTFVSHFSKWFFLWHVIIKALIYH